MSEPKPESEARSRLKPLTDSSTPPPDTIVIIDPSLCISSGHHLGSVQRVVHGARLHGLKPVVLVAKSADAEVLSKVAAKPVFTSTIYSRVKWNRWEFAQRAHRFKQELETALTQYTSDRLVFVVPTSDQVVVAGLASYLRSSPLRYEPTVVMWILLAPRFYLPVGAPGTKRQEAEYRQAFVALRDAVGEDRRVQVFCETSGFADFYSNLSGLPVGVVPSSNMLDLSPRKTRSGESGAITIVCSGHLTPPKGYQLLPDAVDRVLATHPNTRFLIHGSTKGVAGPEIDSLVGRLSGREPSVIFRTDELANDEYYAWLGSADLILLPYDPEIYKNRGSGLFAEAESMKIPVIAPAGIDFARECIVEGRGVGIASHTSAGVAAAVTDALSRIEELRAACRVGEDSAQQKLGIDELLKTALADSPEPRRTRGGWAANFLAARRCYFPW